MHDKTFPQSDESPDARSQRAVAALAYEEEAGLGFRRLEREPGVSSPYSKGHALPREETPGNLWGGYIASVGLILAASAAVYKPIITAFSALILLLIGLSTDGRGHVIAKWGLAILSVSWMIGMTWSVLMERPIY